MKSLSKVLLLGTALSAVLASSYTYAQEPLFGISLWH